MGEFWRLVGATLLGALISFGTTFFFERRKEDRAEQAEDQRRRKELRQATRLVWEELQINWQLLETAAEGRLWSSPPHDLDQHVWLQYRATLALYIEDEAEWETIATAQVEIGDLNRRLGISRALPNFYHKADGSILDEWAEVINHVLVSVRDGVSALANLLPAPEATRPDSILSGRK